MTGQARIWTGEKKANMQRARAQDAYNSHVGYLNNLHSQHSGMLGNLRDMGTHLGNIEGQAKGFENHLQNLDYQGQQHEQYKSALAGYSSHLDNQGRNVASNELKLSTELTRYKQDEDSFTKGATDLSEKKKILEDSFKSFSDKAPAFGKFVEDYQKLPDEVNRMQQELATKKEALAGMTAEERQEASEEISNYENTFAELKTKRADAEKMIKEQLGSITEQHNELSNDKIALEKGMKDYTSLADKLTNTQTELTGKKDILQMQSDFAKNERDQYQSQYDQFNTMLADFNKKGESLVSQYKKTQSDYANKAQEYTDYQGQVQGKIKEIEGFESTYQNEQNKLDGLADEVGFYARKTAKKQQITGAVLAGMSILAGNLAGVGLKALGAPTWLSAGAKMGIKLGGGLGALQHANKAVGMGKMQQLNEMDYTNGNLSSAGGNLNVSPLNAGIYNINSQHTPISFGNLGNPQHVNIPQLGNLPLAVEHFGMPTMPEVTKLPQLSQSLGRLTSAEDLNKLNLGLSSTTMQSGRKFNHETYLNPDYLKKLKRVTKGLGYRANQLGAVA